MENEKDYTQPEQTEMPSLTENQSQPEASQTEPAEYAELPKYHDPYGSGRELFEWLELFTYAVAVVAFVFIFVCRIAVVHGPSMENTLHEGEVLLVSDLFYEPKAGDIIVFQSNTILNDEAIVKRVIATEGQIVDIDFDSWTVTVDGVPLEEPYVNYIMNHRMLGSSYTYPLEVEPGKIFVMGDNRNHSTDSRSELIGQVDTRFVLGRLLVRLYPFDKCGSVD